MPVSPAFNVNDVTRSFEERDRTRGRLYQNQGRVRELHIENKGMSLSAKVQGSTADPYIVKILVEKRNGQSSFHTQCTCPAVYMCKHAAAALFEAIAQLNRQREKLPPNKPYEQGRKMALTKEGDLKTWVNSIEAEQTATENSDLTQRLVYIVSHASGGRKSKLMVTPALENALRNGAWSKPQPQSFQKILHQNQHKPFLTEADQAVFRLIKSSPGMNYTVVNSWHAPEDPALIDLFLNRVIETGRAFYPEASANPLRLGVEIPSRLAWTVQQDGRQKPVLTPEQQGLIVLMSNSPWYINPVTQETGPVGCALSFDLVQNFLEAPALTPKEAEALRLHLTKTKSKLPLPYRVVQDKKEKRIKPTAHLYVRPASDNIGNEAFLMMNYEGELLAPACALNPAEPPTHYYVAKNDEVVLHKRDMSAEAALIKQLAAHKLEPQHAHSAHDGADQGLCLLPAAGASPWFWLDFRHEIAPQLEKLSFTIEFDKSGGLDVLDTDDDAIDASFTQNGEWWFSLDLGITINGQRVALLPILVSFLRGIHSPADIERLTAGNKCYAPLPDGRHVALPSARVKTILQTLLELFGDKPLDDKGKLRVSFDLAAALSQIKAFTSKRWLGEGSLKTLVERLGDFKGIEEIPLPLGLNAELRHYQKEGYDWLHFLGTYNLAGVLADDMGLGKTIQALAYILALKRKKKSGPCLVIMPTSLVTNWQTESARFTPELKVLTLHGKDRAEKFDEIATSDLVLSTYPLAMRDIGTLCEHKWGLVILDEAQAIKNPSSKVMQAVCKLEAKQRLCLTGTPLENHLGEIWSIFTFLMPGLLGDYKQFTRLYRTPIEKQGDTERQLLLSRRLRPFILRRLKSDVTKELPPKTEIIQRVTLGDDQRDLYETVRHVMNEKVREEVTAKGFARSHIVILDALLKLRQVCCDPRLVKLAAASKVKSSAKLAALMEILPTLIEDGRRILLFSQFTSMLDLIKPELDEAGIGYVELRGTTKDRRTPVVRFQKKEVPLFLISLKAGGTGLNLTAADTVIHFDPWWNPSVENQATDRAHRIGQDKNVFVYKLIAEGTVEERILDLQTKKANLAGALLGDTPAAAAALTPDDLQWLLEDFKTRNQ